MGRPTKFTKELADEICQEIASGKSLKRVCEAEKFPTRATIHNWLLDATKPEFFDNYSQAVNIRAELMFDELEEVAESSIEAIVGDDKSDGARVQARKLLVDTRKWYLSKVMPKKYGDKLDLTSDGEKLPTPIYGGASSRDS